MATSNRLLGLLGSVRRMLAGGAGATTATSASAATVATAPVVRSPSHSGPTATVEIDPADVGDVQLSYSPSTDGDPDPGEIVWTWVPYEENDGRGKDRPVVIIASERGGSV